MPESSMANSPSPCFGRVNPTEAVAAFGHEMNREMMAFLRSLPASTHADAVVFFMQHFRTPFFPAFNYFRNYHTPSWSIIYWLDQMGADHGLLTPEDSRHARTAHAMALFLHPLDDHLEDGQLPATHLHVLIRSQAWLRMNAALDRLTAVVAGGTEIVKDLVNDYYASIGVPPKLETLDGYGDHFRKQMATGMIVPALLMAKMKCGSAFTGKLKTAYGAFGLAWRLLDDLQDLDVDMKTGSHSAIYFSLPPDIRQLWDQTSQNENAGICAKIRAIVYNDGAWEAIRKRICLELASAASTMEEIQMTGLAEELRCLARPLMDRPATS